MDERKQSSIVKRTREIADEFDDRAIAVGVGCARLELAKALAESEAAIAQARADKERVIAALEHRVRVLEQVSESARELRDSEIARLRALVSVGREMVEAMLKYQHHTAFLLAKKWRSLEVK